MLSGSGRTHSSSVVNDFVQNWILPLVSNLLANRNANFTRTEAIETVKQQIAPLDDFLYQVIMEKRNNNIHPDTIPISFAMLKDVAEQFWFRSCFLFCQDFYLPLPSVPPSTSSHFLFVNGTPQTFDTYGRDIIRYLLEVSNVATEFPKWEGTFLQQLQESYKREMVAYVKHLCATLTLKGQVKPVGTCCYTPQLAEIDNQASIESRSYHVECFPWSQFSERMFKEQSSYPWLIGPERGDLSVKYRTFYPNLLWIVSVGGDWVIVPGQEHLFYTQQSVESEAIKRTMQVQPEIQIFKKFLIALREVMRVLAEYPIEEDSGRQEIVMGHGIQLSSAEMAARISNQLSGLTNFTARVKVGEKFLQNPPKKCLGCGFLIYPSLSVCGHCGTKISDQNEYTITTLAPGQGIGKTAFDQRIAYIQARNRDPQYGGYCRPRNDVEAEIIQRQTSCSGGSFPAQPQLPQPPRRIARQVPVQGNCSNCGASNPPGSQFCNQCGNTL